jgi:hypothetical protein
MRNRLLQVKKIGIFLTATILLFIIQFNSASGQCGFNNNTNSNLVITPCINMASNVQTVSTTFACKQYFLLNVIKGLTYQIYTCNTTNPSNALRIDLYNQSNGTLLASSNSNTGNPCTNQSRNVNISYLSTITGQIRVNINRTSDCTAVTPNGLTVNVNVSSGSNTQDDQNAAGNNTWIGHIYDGTNSGVAYTGSFSNYLGYYTQSETFDESFGSQATDNYCFASVNSNGVVRASVLNTTFAVRYRMNSTRDGLYVADMGSDDGSRLIVDGTLVYNNWIDQAYSSKPRILFNLNGTSSLVYDFYENTGSNQVVFQNLTLVLANNLNLNTSQSICLGSSGAAISGDTYGTLPTGISVSGTGYQWTYSTTPGGARTTISGATGATFTPNTSNAPFNVAGTYYVYRNAVLVSTNNTGVANYTATNESNAATITIGTVPTTVSVSGAGTFCGSTTITASGGTGGTTYFQGTTSGGTSTATPSTSAVVSTSGTYYFRSQSASGCWSTEGSATVTINALPTEFNVTGGGFYCTGGTGVAIGLSGSQTGVSYQLYNGVNAVGSLVAGTGSALYFGNYTASGTYTVTATNQSTLCARNMTGNATITELTVPDFTAAITNTTCPVSSDGTIIPDNRLDPAIEFSNADQNYIDLGSNLLSNRATFTIEGLVKFDKANLGSRMSLLGQNDAIEFGFANPTTIQCWTQSGGSATAPISAYPDDNGWHHIAAVGNGTTITIYIDGTSAGSGGSATTNYSNNTGYTAKIGGSVWDATGGSFNGQIKKVGFWSTALTPAQLASYASGYASYTGSEAGLIAGYNFLEGSGTSLARLPSGSSGTFQNSPVWTNVLTFAWTKTGDGSFNRTTKNISGLTPGEYNLTATTGTCSKSNSFQVSSINPATTISSQSTGAQSQCIGGTFTPITVTSSGAGTLTYQWYSNTSASTSGGTSLGSGNGSQTNSYTPQASATGTLYYYCIVSATCGTVTSAISGAFTVNALPDPPTAGSNVFTYDGSVRTATANVGANETVDWYANPTGSTTASVPSGTNVGTYSAYAETRNTSTGCVSATRTLITLTINKANSSITATGSTSFTYSGLEQGPNTSTVTGSTGAVTYSYSGTGSTTYGPNATRPVNAGTYQVIATVASDANYNGSVSAALPFTINKAVLTITAGNQTVVFGTPATSVTGAGSYTPEGFVNSETSSVISGTATYTTSYTEVTSAGTAGVTITPEVTGLSATNYSFLPVNGTITIDKANSTITATGATTFTYSGLAQGPASSTVTGSTGAVNYSYSGTGSTIYGPTNMLPTDAGTYQVIATVDADVNYNGAVSAALPFTIEKAVITITAGNQTVVFGTPATSVISAGSYTPTGFVNSETASVISGTATYTTTYTEATPAGTAGVTITPEVTGLLATNYSLTPAIGTITIDKANSTITANGTTTFTYSGLSQGPATSTVTGSTGAVTYSYSGTGSTTYGPGTTLPTDAGTYQVIAAVDADLNYYGAVSAALPFTIEKAVLTITAGNQTVPYGTPISTVIGAGSYTASGFVNSETASLISGTATYTTTYTEVTSAGTADVTITPEVTGLSATNYSFTPAIGTVTIDKANSTITVTGSTTFTYSGLAQGPATSTVTGSTGAVTYIYSGTGGTTYGPSATQPVNAGTYEVIATVTSDANYNEATSAAMPFTIEKAALTITANDQSKCVGTTFSFTGVEVSSAGLKASDEVSSVTLTSSGSLAPAASGVYDIVPSDAVGTGLDNYEITYSTGGKITVNDLPTGTLSNSGSICSGSSASITFTKILGTGPFDLVINGETYTDITSGGTINLSPTDVSTTYTLTSITDKGVSPNCPNVVNVSTTVSVFPIEVNASMGLTQACYNTVKEAFDKINDGTHKGEITVKVNGSTSETASAVLNASGSGSSDFTSVILYPTATGLSISGSINNPLIDFNGADNVTIDGRVNAIGLSEDLTISNSGTGAAASTMRFRNDASANNIQYCTIQGSSTAVTTGTIFFSTGTSTGNDGNIIAYNTISAAGSNLPVNAIYSAGTSVAVDNSGNTISSNEILDFFSPTLASNGIYVASNSSTWTISGNKLFQTATRTATVANTHRGINIITASGTGYIVSNNIIGNGNSSGTGTSNYAGAVGSLYRGIELTVGTTVASSVQGNTIDGISFSTTSASGLPGIFSGISVLGGKVDIGTENGNVIGETSGNGAIVITSATTAGVITGIYSSSTNSVNIRNNKIGSISTAGGNAIGYTFQGIYTAGAAGNYTIASNTIGSSDLSTSNSISVGSATTTAVCTFYGINNAATGTISITGNTVQKATVYGTGASVFNGILNTAGSVALDINSNTIISGKNTGTGAFIGISNSSTAATTNINSNTIRNISRTTATGTVTGISSTGAITAALNINENHLGDTEDGFVTYDVANSNALVGITVSGATGACDLSIQNNDFRGINYTIAGTNANTYIINTAGTKSQNISNNTFTNLNVNTTGNVIFISNSVISPANGSQTVSGNSIVTGFRKSSAGGTLTGITSTAATANSGVTVNIEDNNFSNITVTGSTAINGIVNTDAGAGAPVKTIRNNTLTFWTGGTGALQGISVNGTGSSGAVTLNTIGNFSNGNSITGITTGAGNDNIFSNQISLLSASTTAAAIISGITITAATTKNIYQNTISGLSSGTGITTGSVRGIAVTGGASVNVYQNEISGLAGNSITTGTVNGILISGGTNITASQNTINGLSGNSLTTLTAGSLNGIAITGGTTITAYQNKIYDLSTSNSSFTGTINGIVSSGNTTSRSLTLYNNMIGDLRATAGSGNDLVRGISLISSGTNSNHNVLFNTIYLSSSSTGTNFGSSGIYHTASATSTTATLNLQNNLVANLSTPKGTGRSVAFRRSSTTLANYSGSSDNNSYYAGTPGSSNLIYYDGTNSDQTLTSFQTRMSSRDQASVSVNPDFLSTSGSDGNFLHLADANCELDGTGKPGSGITTDFDNDTRDALLPDIGADEFTGTGKIPVSVTIAAVPSGAVCPGTSVTFTATPVNGGSLPVYTWYNGASVISGETLSTYTSGALTNGDVISVKMMSNATCISGNPATSNAVTMVVNALPVPTITGDSSPCAETSGVIYTTESGMTNYSWSISAGGSIASGESTNTINVIWNDPGTQTVSVNYSNGSSCTAVTATVQNVNVNPLPNPAPITTNE